MNVLLAHYVVRCDIASNNGVGLSSAKTPIGVKLRSDRHNGELFVNGAKIVKGDLHCSNGVIHVVDRFDPSLVREALTIVTAARSVGKP
ncbi:MAG: fasciclin domain-containing protein [Candidatus Sulfotelmatobacter sp.]